MSQEKIMNFYDAGLTARQLKVWIKNHKGWDIAVSTLLARNKDGLTDDALIAKPRRRNGSMGHKPKQRLVRVQVKGWGYRA